MSNRHCSLILSLMTTSSKVPTSFLVISGVALVWNILGALAYVVQVTMSPEALAQLPEAEQAIYANLPSWVTAAFAIAVWAGVAGSILLLLKKEASISCSGCVVRGRGVI